MAAASAVANDGGLAAQDHVQQLRRAEALGNGLQILKTFRRLDEGHIRARFDVALSALDRRLEALDGAGVRSGDDDHALAARIHSRAHLADHLVRRDELLAGEMAAAFRRVLVLDLNGACAGLLQRPHRVRNVDRIAEAGVRVDDQRQVDTPRIAMTWSATWLRSMNPRSGNPRYMFVRPAPVR